MTALFIVKTEMIKRIVKLLIASLRAVQDCCCQGPAVKLWPG